MLVWNTSRIVGGKSWPPAPGVSPPAPTSRPAPPSWPASTHVPIISTLPFFPKTIFERNWWFGRLHHDADEACQLLGRWRVLGKYNHKSTLGNMRCTSSSLAGLSSSLESLILDPLELKVKDSVLASSIFKRVEKFPKTRTDKCPLIVAECHPAAL